MSTMYSIGQMNQLGDALEAAGFTVDDVTKLRSFPDLAAIKSVVNGLAKIVLAKLLSKIRSVPVNGAENFVLTEDVLKESNVGHMGDNFKKLFLDKTEKNVPGVTLAIHRLESDSLNDPIRTELGDCADIKLAYYLFELLKRQSKREGGALLTDGCANVVYLEDKGGNIWAVSAYWSSGGGYWCVGASSVEDPHRWHAGYQVLSHS